MASCYTACRFVASCNTACRIIANKACRFVALISCNKACRFVASCNTACRVVIKFGASWPVVIKLVALLDQLVLASKQALDLNNSY